MVGLRAHALDRGVEADQPVDRRFPSREILVDIDEPRERPLYLVERRGGLEDHAKLNFARKEPRRDHDVRKDDRQLRVEVRVPVELLEIGRASCRERVWLAEGSVE